MTQLKPVGIALLIAVIMCALHFWKAVYVSIEPQARETVSVPLASLNNTAPYNADILLQLFQQWAATPEQTEEQVASEPPDLLADYDQARLGNMEFTLLAIYHLDQPKAVLAYQSPGEPIIFVRLSEGEMIGTVLLSKVNPRDVVLSQGEQSIALRLFNLPNASTEQ